ncbi:Potassium voltage-gated channel subfamily H member 2 [Rhizoctonia solani]|uniref:Potassium voltage-gated channel subfamily H member 2 n=1 Tax=Rhizoctonia solani TaxID=456999 RepID=A0A0K6GEG7_9AGAM|nr:Potassium voltage-gated channel subfamily H member 2 [Rhizoctonia solani]
MTHLRPNEPTPSDAYEGPRDDQPLTEEELSILLAIPRAAENAPNSTAFRIPLGIDPSLGWIDVTWSEARSIVARLAATWATRISDLTSNQNSPPVGPGITVCILVQPSVTALFHIFAFWALGCTVQFISLSLDEETIDLYLNKSGCKVVVYSNISGDWIRVREKSFNGPLVSLPENEYAHQLAKTEKGGGELAVPWPKPQRPTPAVVLHSSATTGIAKLLSFSLYYYTLGLPKTIQNARPAMPHISNPNLKTPMTHPFLIFSPPYWQSFHGSLFNHLVSGTSTTFAHVPDIMKLPSSQLITWARALDVGGMLCAPRFLQQSLASDFEDNSSFLQSLYMVVVCGSAIDDSTSALIEKHGLKFMNAYGCTEMGGVLYTTQAPYTHLRMPITLAPLVHPISDIEPNGSRQVQLWHSLSTSPQLAHLYAKGGVPLQIEPYPGTGPHAGKPAVNLGDVFEQVRLPPNSDSEFAYVHLGRSDDVIKLSGGGGWNMNAAPYETRIRSLISSRQIGWTVDTVQLFGGNLPCTVLVIQISPSGEMQNADAIPDLGSLVTEANEEFKLESRKRVHIQKRLLVITPNDVRGPDAAYIRENRIRLSTTHKHTIQRWKNVQTFRVWLDRLDFSEP